MMPDEANTSKPPLPPPRSIGKRLAIWLAEVLLVLVIVGLLIATWLPAYIGGTPEPPQAMPRAFMR